MTCADEKTDDFYDERHGLSVRQRLEALNVFADAHDLWRKVRLANLCDLKTWHKIERKQFVILRKLYGGLPKQVAPAIAVVNNCSSDRAPALDWKIQLGA